VLERQGHTTNPTFSVEMASPEFFAQADLEL
jgi:hypothetical protein